MDNNDWRFEITFKTSADAEAKANKESVENTTVVVFKDWVLADLLEYAATTVKINQIQPKIRNGEAIGAEFVASRPGTKPEKKPKTAWQKLVDAMGEPRAKKAVEKFGTAEKALEALAAFIGE